MAAGADRPLLPALAVAAGLVAQNIGAALAKHLFPLVGSEGVTALRVGLSAALLLATWRPWRRPLAARDVATLAIYGFMLGCMNLLIYRAFALIPIGIAIAIEVTGPIAVVLFASRRRGDFAWVACAIAGLALLLPLRAGAARLDPAGVAWAAGAAFCWAMYIVFGKRAASLHGGDAVAWGMLAAAVFTVPVGVVHAGGALLSPLVLLGGLGVALLSSALPYSLEMFALARLPRRVFGMMVSSAPAVGALAGFAVLGEWLAPLQWLAIGLVILAAAGSAWSAGRGCGSSGP
jgi:inner membrane transporter RhtA